MDVRRVADGRNDYAVSQVDGRYYVAAHGTAAGRRAESLFVERKAAPMTPEERARAGLERAELRHRFARAQLLRQLARPGASLPDLLSFAADIDGAGTASDCVAAFRSAQDAEMRAAQGELERRREPLLAAVRLS